LAHAAAIDAPAGTLIAGWMDAHRREVFAAVYRVTAAAPFSFMRLENVEGPTVGEPAATLERWTDTLGIRPAVFVGDGAILYEPVIRQVATDARIAPAPLLAATIGRLAIARIADASDPTDVRPLYVRRPDAEIARDQR